MSIGINAPDARQRSEEIAKQVEEYLANGGEIHAAEPQEININTTLRQGYSQIQGGTLTPGDVLVIARKIKKIFGTSSVTGMARALHRHGVRHFSGKGLTPSDVSRMFTGLHE